MTHLSEGDIAMTKAGRKWRVIDQNGDVVQAEEVETFVVSHFHRDDLTVIEKHPGGPR